MAMHRDTSEKYIDGIRSGAKQDYAIEYLAFLRSGCIGDVPSNKGIGQTLAEYVRLRLGMLECGL